MQKVLGNLKKGMLLVVSAPAGTGKTTLVQMLMNEFPCVIESVSFTTRQPRESEVEGVHYNFITKEEFEQKIAEGEFLEHAKIYDDYYGTSRKWVEEQRNQGNHVVLVIDTQGALQLMEHTDAAYIFIQPPSLDELKARLIKRQTETFEAIEKRLDWAKKEIAVADAYDYQIINDDLNTTYQVLRSVLIAEEHKTSNSK